MAEDEWHHVVGTWNGYQACMYVNGVLSECNSWSTAPASSGNAFMIGGYTGEKIKASIDEVVIYNKALTADEVMQRRGIWLNTAKINDASGGGAGIQAGDQVIITFDGETNGATIDAANIDTVLALSGGHSWKDGSGAIGSAVWSMRSHTNDTLTITLSTDTSAPTVAAGDTMTLDGTIEDLYRSIFGSTTITGGVLPGTTAYWDFDEGSGSTAYDGTGHDNNGTITGATWTTPGRFSNALSFDGSNDRVTTALKIDQSATSPGVTMEAWVYPTSTSTGRHQVISSDNGGYDWSLLRDGATWRVFTGATSWNTGFSVDLEAWQHVVAVFIPGTGTKFYKNGVEAFTTNIGYDTGDDIIAVGQNPPNAEYFAGIIDEVVVYSRALTAEEVRERYGAMPKTVHANDASGGGAGIQAGDQVVITFKGETDGATINAANIDTALALSNSHSWKDGSGAIGSAVWSTSTYTNDTLTITLSTATSAPTVALLDTVTLDGTIKDKFYRAIIDSIPIVGSFDENIPTGAVAFWRFDEGSGSTAYDPNGNNGTLRGDTSWTGGKFGSALSFDGTGDYVEVPHNSSINPVNITVELWAKSNTATWNETGMLVSKRNAYILHPTGGSKIMQFYFYDGEWHCAEYTSLKDLTQWHHYAGTYDGAWLKIYEDGVLMDSLNYAGSIGSDTGSLFIGWDDGISGRYFDGFLDEVVIYDSALTAEEVEARYTR